MLRLSTLVFFGLIIGSVVPHWAVAQANSMETVPFTLYRISNFSGKKLYISTQAKFDLCTTSNSILAIPSLVDYQGHTASNVTGPIAQYTVEATVIKASDIANNCGTPTMKTITSPFELPRRRTKANVVEILVNSKYQLELR